MRGVNKVTLIGNMVRKPHIGVNAEGERYAFVNIACNYSFPDKSAESGWGEGCDFLSVSFNGKTVEFIEKLTKGQAVYIEGKLGTKNVGTEEQPRTEIVVRGWTLLALGSPQGQAEQVDKGSDTEVETTERDYELEPLEYEEEDVKIEDDDFAF